MSTNMPTTPSTGKVDNAAPSVITDTPSTIITRYAPARRSGGPP
jgi:hypothetical protein